MPSQRPFTTVLTLSFSLVFLLSCSDKSNRPQETTNTALERCGRVDVDKLVNYLTSDKQEQKIIRKFVCEMEDVFKISPEVLFSSNDYLTVIFQKMYITRLSFHFSTSRPGVNVFEGDDNRGTMLYWNEDISYQVTLYQNETSYQSWYESPSKHGNWSHGSGFRQEDSGFYWYKIVDLNELGL